jgi:uncharacterized membrane protein YkvA (DUF1232 family)
METISRSKIQSLVKKCSQEASEIFQQKDILLEKLNASWEKAKSLDPELRALVDNIAVFIEIIREFIKGNYKEIDRKNILLMIAGILYFLNPLDLIPDIIPILGFGDDAAVLLFVLGKVKVEIVKYKDWKFKNSELHYES